MGSKYVWTLYIWTAWDIEILLKDLGWIEIMGIHNRGIYDLKHRDKNEHILELTMEIDRLFYAMMDNYYLNKEKSQGKTIFRIPYKLSPIKVSILPLVKNNIELIYKAKEWLIFIKKLTISVEYDQQSSIGKRYLRNNLKGIPFSLTIDYDTLKNDTITMRDRDSENQTRMNRDEVKKFLCDYI